MRTTRRLWWLIALAGCGGDDRAACEPPRWEVAATPDALREQCRAFSAARCRRAFDDCSAPLYAVYEGYGDLRSCLDEAPADDCNPAAHDWAHAVIDRDVAGRCLAALPTIPCADFLAEGGPPVCQPGSWPAPPDPADCVDATPGRFTVPLATEAGGAWSGRVAMLCVCASSGQHLTLRYVRTASGDPVSDPTFQPLAPGTGRPLPGRWVHRYDADVAADGVTVVVFGDADHAPATHPSTAEIELTLAP
jgi:hypothetical protein